MPSGIPRPGYHLWKSMMRRCHDERCHAFKGYGARGIQVCKEWRDFEVFMAEFGSTKPSAAHTMDRIDNNGNYEPANVRWSLPIQQQNNRRNNVLVTVNGETKTVTEWARKVGIPCHTIRRRIELGWTPELTVSKPVRQVVYIKKPGRKPNQLKAAT